jgi:spermidine synthase
MLLAQQFLTRIFTILFNSGLAFLAISITFLGLGSAGVCVYVFPRVFAPSSSARRIPALALAYAIALVAGVYVLLAIDNSSASALANDASLRTQVIGVTIASLLLLPAMFLVGLVISLVLRTHASRVGKLYGADLVGGAFGCLLVLPLMRYVGGDQGLFVVALIAAAGATLLAHAHQRPGTRTLAALGTLALACMPLFNREHQLLDVRSRSIKLDGVTGWAVEDHELRRAWNELSRLGVFDTRDHSALYVRIDSSCQTTIPSNQAEHLQQYVDSTNFEHLPYVLGRHRRYLEIGAGGGRGMFLANASGAERIVGVEINPDIVDMSLNGFPGYGVGPLVADPRHQLIAAEGRGYARGTDEQFDTVTITFIQTGVANSSAAFALSEANLFTVEAFTEFMGRLGPNGLFYVYRHSGNEMLRLLAMSREALKNFGVDDPRQHLFAARNSTDRAALLVSRSPLAEQEIAKLEQASADLKLEVLYSPSRLSTQLPPNPFPERIRQMRAAGTFDMGAAVREYRDLSHDARYQTLEQTLVASADPDEFVDDYLVDIRPTHDDRPYYFFQGLNRPSDWPLYFDLGGVGILGGTVILLFWMAAAFAVLVTLLIVLPLVVRRENSARGGRGMAVIAYFSGLGLGYIAVQISFIQRFVLFLGHPVYALSVVLLSFLLFSGLGSMSSERLFNRGVLSLGRIIGALAVLLLVYNELLPYVFHSQLISWPVGAKVALSMALILPLAFLMGCLFPHGIRMVSRVAPQLTPWAWGANSATSVLGSIFSLVLAIHAGFSITALVAAALYALFCLPAGWALARWARAQSL